MNKLTIIALLMTLTLSFVAMAQEDSGDGEPDPVVTTRVGLPDTSQFRLVQVARGFVRPTYVTHAADGSGRLFVLEQTGRIWIVRDGQTLPTPFLDITPLVSQDVLNGFSERGLLGLAFHPDFAANGQFYINYNDRNGETHIVAYTVFPEDPNSADPNSARELMFVDQPYPNHNGSQLEFGPDGYLYISLGDGGSRDDPADNAQNPTTLLGTILRIDADDWDIDRPYGIPEDNPYTVNPQLAPEIWAWGLRNVWRFSFDRATGDLYMGDVGQNQIEEINFQPAESAGGENYGWNRFEGTRRYLGPEPTTPLVGPIAEYTHADGCSVTGGYVYRGELIPELTAAYLYSDFCNGNIWAAYRDETGAWQSGFLFNAQMSVSSFGEDEAGELYVLNYVRGELLRFEPRPQ